MPAKRKKTTTKKKAKPKTKKKKAKPKTKKEKKMTDDVILAAISHACVIFYFFGTIAALIIWITYKDRSKLVRFHSLQAIVFQSLLYVAFMAGMLLYIVSFFLLFFTTIAAAILPAGAAISGLMFFIPMAIFMGMFLLFPIWMTIGLYAAYKTSQGEEFSYPILGDKLRHAVYFS